MFKSIIEYLIEKNKNRLLNSKFQNTIYKGKTLNEYFNILPKSSKDGLPYSNLLCELIYDLPLFDYELFIKNMNIYSQYPNLYLRSNQALIKISDIINHIKRYKDKEEIPISKCSASFFNRKRSVVFYNKNTKELIKHYITSEDYDNLFNNILRFDYKILETIPYNDYEDMIKKIED